MHRSQEHNNTSNKSIDTECMHGTFKLPIKYTQTSSRKWQEMADKMQEEHLSGLQLVL